MEIVTMYEQLGVSRAVYEYGEAVLRDLRPRFDVIDQTAEYNQGKVLAAMQKNRVNATHFAATTGYGYDDEGRDNLERVYADVFHTEAALVRPQITCGTHALTVALSANLLPGDELLSPAGAPYDTLEEVIGIRESPCSLKEYGVTYRPGGPAARRQLRLRRHPREAINAQAPSSSPSSAPRATPPAPPSRCSRSGS